MTDTAAIRDVVERSFPEPWRVDVVVSNAGYGLFGAAEELSHEQIEHVIRTNLLGSIADPRGAATPTRAGCRAHHRALLLRRPGRVPGQLALEASARQP